MSDHDDSVSCASERPWSPLATESAAGWTSPAPGPAVTARREYGGASNITGAPAASGSTVWPVLCWDAVGRVRQLTVRRDGDGGAVLGFPPGEAAVLGPRSDEILDLILGAVALRPVRWLR